MANLTFIPGWGVWVGAVLLGVLLIMIFRLKKETRALEAKADAIEEIQEARRSTEKIRNS